MRAALVLALIALLAAPSRGAESVVELPTRPGATLRVLLIVPDSPRASLVLLAGGSGAIGLRADGTIERGDNHLVRVRAKFAAAGFAVAVPDMASDLRGDDRAERSAARLSPAHEADLAAIVRRMRALAAPVIVVGTSRGALSAAVAARGLGDARPDARVLTSALLLPRRAGVPDAASLFDAVPTLPPMLLVAHRADACPLTPAADVAPFAARLAGRARIETRLLDGGGPPAGERCGNQHFHGLAGVDDEFVAMVAAWAATPPR